MLVVGCGGIGGNLVARLSEQDPMGATVVGLTTNERIAETVNEQGFTLQGVDGTRRVTGTLVTTLSEQDRFDLIILATQPPQVEGAARGVLPHLDHQGAMLVLQNGLCEERIQPIAGDERVIGAVIAWGASMPEPGVYVRTSSGGFTIGRLDGSLDDPRLSTIATMLEHVGPVDITDNLRGARWSKLAINCAISTLGTIGGDRLGALMRYRFVRRLALEVMTEVVAVARAEGVTLRKVSGTIDLDWMALTPAERASRGSASLVAKHSLLLAVGTRYRNLRSSMLSAIERGRQPAVDFLNGEVVERGRRHGIATPVNTAAQALVHRIADGTVQSSVDTLRDLAKSCQTITPSSGQIA